MAPSLVYDSQTIFYAGSSQRIKQSDGGCVPSTAGDMHHSFAVPMPCDTTLKDYFVNHTRRSEHMNSHYETNT